MVTSKKNRKNIKQSGQNKLFPGQPGYRTRPGSSGLDPMDTRMESAYVQGTLLKELFNTKFFKWLFWLLRGHRRKCITFIVAGLVLTIFDAYKLIDSGSSWGYTILLIIGIILLWDGIGELYKGKKDEIK